MEPTHKQGWERWNQARQAVDLQEAMNVSDMEFAELREAYRRNIDELAKAYLKTDKELLADLALPKWVSYEGKNSLLESARYHDLIRARSEVMEPLKFPETADGIIARMAHVAEMAEKAARKAAKPQKTSR